MSREALSIVKYLLGLAALCVVSIVLLDALDRTDAEVLTILGTSLATIVGAVAGVVVGQKAAEPPAEPPLTGPDLGEHLGLYQGAPLTSDAGVLVDADGDGTPDAQQIAAFLGRE